MHLYLHAYLDRTSQLVRIDPKSQAILAKAMAKAHRQTNAALLEKIAERRARTAHGSSDGPVDSHSY